MDVEVRAAETADTPDADEHHVDWPEEDGSEIKIGIRCNVSTRNFPLMKADFDKHGRTEGCRGCVALRRGRAPVWHNQESRTSMAEHLRRDPATRGRVTRAEEHIAGAVRQAAEAQIRRVGEEARALI